VAKRYAEERGWKVLHDHIYTDAAVSGASINGRTGVQRLLFIRDTDGAEKAYVRAGFPVSPLQAVDSLAEPRLAF
jgi:hypothetical protein